ncbi:hypothetical protein [Mucilaginibacter pedocola]|uniref:Uncharacterized protein n=1 Tax=Mucilaginibacter pedocola TaxID=1792845 RepID=A0A1S9PI67_9SPHI|nr:hypothetical protein [Mucilaginibacter pedocola]OOQ60632.1 hypothetical protein BC343_23835 [Mucilaginibacter pedocola]
MSDLSFIESKDLKFFHSSDGTTAVYKNKKVIFRYLSMTHPDASFTADQYVKYAEAVGELVGKLKNLPIHSSTFKKPVSSNDIINDFSPFYKYVPESTFQKHIINGDWQLGTIQQYRTIENINQRDELEGCSFLNFTVNNRIISSYVTSGFNYLIFCGTKTPNSEDLENQFGTRKLFFPNVKSFADRICKSINAKRYYIQNVEYNSLKLYVCKDSITIDKAIHSKNILSSYYLDLIQKYLVYPNLFVKPESFKKENEVRIVFEMERDCNKPYKFNSKEVLSYIRY